MNGPWITAYGKARKLVLGQDSVGFNNGQGSGFTFDRLLRDPKRGCVCSIGTVAPHYLNKGHAIPGQRSDFARDI
jgi:hypothetical protein